MHHIEEFRSPKSRIVIPWLMLGMPSKKSFRVFGFGNQNMRIADESFVMSKAPKVRAVAIMMRSAGS